MTAEAEPAQPKLLIRPFHITFATLLNGGTHQTPRYQRNYAWRAEEIAAFLKDLDLCRAARMAGQPRHHFFGGVVTAVAPVQGSDRPNLEVIDGQQRLATVLMLINQLARAMEALAGRLNPPDAGRSTFLTKTAELLRERYQVFEDTIEFNIVPVPRLDLSLPDRAYFASLLAGTLGAPQRKSHELLSAAFISLGAYLDAKLAEAVDDEARVGLLEALRLVFEKDWTIIHMKAENRRDAYMLFQTLNDRGRGLTEGELLRASTLEALEPIATAGEMAAVEASWNVILNGQDIDVGRALGSAYASQIGDAPGEATLLTDLQTVLFPMLTAEPFTRTEADALIATVRALELDIATLTTIVRGEWPLPAHASVCGWDRDRLRLLIVHLQQYDCLPLLITAPLLAPAKFSQIVQILERFCFRYAVMVEGPRIEAAAVINRHAVEVRRDPAQYRPVTLEGDLRELLALHAPDDVFRDRLSSLRYPRAESRKPLKYFLMTLEHYVRWFDEGAQGRPVCRDLTRLLDFENTTIEHVYPENAEPPDATLEPLLDTLGNLTILSPDENIAAGDKTFDRKRPYFRRSTCTLNQQIGAVETWTVSVVETRQARLIDIALAVFRL
ncbi:MAG TPA: DUF262 domain-containing HNH endonuclease family protein [Caulobacteraceae bacterium]|jgi:hypothetical protein